MASNETIIRFENVSFQYSHDRVILDEPLNFRHLPNIAAALDAYEGAMILVSHVSEFVDQIRIDDVLDLEK